MDQFKIIEGRGFAGGALLVFDKIDSTNSWALANLADCGNGDVILAVEQTAGRGRFQREWFSSSGRSLTVSLVLKQFKPELASNLTQVAVIAMGGVLMRHNIFCNYKWPNDLLASSGKIAGILAELDSIADTIVLGIGLNVNLTVGDLAWLELIQPATSMQIESGNQHDPMQILDEFLCEFDTMLNLTNTSGLSAVLEKWRASDALSGKSVEVTTPSSLLRGRYMGLSDDGSMLILDEDEVVQEIRAGDVASVLA